MSPPILGVVAFSLIIPAGSGHFCTLCPLLPHDSGQLRPFSARTTARTPLQICQRMHDSLKVSSVSGCCFSSHPSQMPALPALPALPTRMIHTKTTKQPEQATTGMHEHANAQNTGDPCLIPTLPDSPSRRLVAGRPRKASYTAQVIEPFNVPTNSGCFQLDHPCRLGPLLHTLPTSPT